MDAREHAGVTASTPTLPSRQRYLLYCSYSLFSLGDRAWEFASVVFMLELFPGTLFYAALFGLLEATTGILSSSWIGHRIDHTPRLQCLQSALIGQDLSITVAAFLYSITLASGTETYGTLLAVYVALVLCAAVARVSSTTAKISIGKDWVVVIAGGDSLLLSSLNASTRRIDLCCSIGAPLFVGLLTTMVTPAVAIAMVGGWNVVSLPVEYKLANVLYASVSALANKSIAAAESPITTDDELEAANGARAIYSAKYLGTTIANIRAYYHHPAFMASLAYCCLFLTVISFGTQMTAYLKATDFSDVTLAAARGVGAIVGVAATVATPFMISRFGVASSAVVCIWLQLSCMTLVLAAFWLPLSAATSTWLLLVGIASSRFGLWSFDLCESQLLQETVQHTAVGAINSMQEATLNWMYLSSFLLTVLFPEPQHFIWPVTVSFVSVTIAALLMSWWHRRYAAAGQYQLLVQRG